MLVVVVTEGATKSTSVYQEIEEFVKTKRVVIPVSVEGAFERAQWSHLVAGVAPERESAEAVSLGGPSPVVIQRIVKSFEFIRSRQRLRRLFFVTTLGTFLVTVFFALLFSAQVRTFLDQVLRLAPPTPSPTPTVGSTPIPIGTPSNTSPFVKLLPPSAGWLIASLLFALLMFREALLSRGASLGGVATDWVYHRFTLSKFYRRRALRDYQQSLLRQFSRLRAPFKSQSSPAVDIYIPLKLFDTTANRTLDPFGALSEYKRLVILGMPGSGKTMLLRRITETFAEGSFGDLPDEPVPVLMEISKLQSPQQDLMEQISDLLRDSKFPDGDAFKRYLTRGKLILLFDGLDEAGDGDRQGWFDGIRNLTAVYPSSRFVVTCRPSSYRDEFKSIGAKTLTIEELDNQQIQDFLALHLAQMGAAKVQTAQPRTAVEQLMGVLRQSPRILSLARNPLLLRLIVELYLSTGLLSSTKSAADFYRQAVDTLLRDRTNERSQFSAADKRMVLQEIAFFISRGESLANRLSIEDFQVSEVAGKVPKTRWSLDGRAVARILDEIVERSNLLISDEVSTGSKRRYRFSHLVFQEFFTAERLIDDPALLIECYLKNPDGWREVVRLWCGMAQEAGSLIRNLYSLDPAFALECLADARSVVLMEVGDIIGSAQNSFCDEGGDGTATERAFGALASSGQPFSHEVFSFLEVRLDATEEPHCRLKAARALAHTQSVTAAEVIARHYTDLPEVRSLLAGMGDAAVPAFVRLVQEGKDGSAQALEDLRAIGTQTARDALTALVPLLGERFESLKQQKPSLRIDFAGRTGFHINRDEILTLRVTNVGTETVKDVHVELEDTSKYTVNTPADSRAVNIERLGAADSREIQYAIKVTQPGLITLQLRIGGGIYKDALLEITAVKDNPYYFGPPVRSAHNFFGRGRELQTSLDHTMSPGGAHTMIIGEQRSGKTSLLFQIKDRLTLPYVPIYISFSGIEREGKMAMSWLLYRIVEELKKGGYLDGKSYSTPLNFWSDFTARLAQIMEGLKQDDPNRKLVLLLDEAHLMNKIGEQFQEVLRETFAQFVAELRVVLACYYDFFDDLRTSSSPLHNIFEFLFLTPFEGDDLRRLIVEPASRFDFEYEKAAIEAVTTMSGGHPYYCQYLCARSYGEAENEKRRMITRQHVEAARQQVLANDKQKFQSGYWDKLRAEDRFFLKQMVSGESTKNVSKDMVNRLVHKFVVKESRGKYVFTASLFEDWVRQFVHEQM